MALTATSLTLVNCSGGGDSVSSEQEEVAVATPLPLPPYDPSKVANPTATVPSGLPMGASDGSFSVGEGGTANYSIPLTVVPGPGNYQPRLALEYGSNGGNGQLGMGFSLSGLSQISRCARTVADDGVAKGVQLDDSDRFCLNGRKLALVSGSYGGDNAEYRTIPDTHVRVRSFRIAGAAGGPHTFEVRLPNGELQLYSDGVAVKKGSVTMLTSWPITSASDTSLDRIHYTYGRRTGSDGGEMERWIDSIQYGYLNNDDRKVSFEYQTRSDKSYGFLYGGRRESTRRLAKVMMSKKVGSSWLEARTYTLAYQNDGSSKASKLTSVQECAYGTHDCTMPTVFGWQLGDGRLAPAATQAAMAPASEETMLVTADLNGDGKTDLAFPEATAWRYVISQGGSLPYGPTVAAGPNPSGTNATAMPFDYDLDGRADLLPRSIQVAPWRPLLSRGDAGGWVKANTEFSGPLNWEDSVAQPAARFGDFDGDGYLDVLEHRAVNGGTSSWTWRQRSGEVSSHIDDAAPTDDLAFGPQQDVTALVFKTPEMILVTDLDDDGRDEVVSNFGGGATLQALDLTGATPLRDTGLSSRVLFLDMIWLDLNGDGLQDLVTNGDDSQAGRQEALFYRLNQGGRFAAPAPMVVSADQVVFRHAEATDLNGDGRDELLLARSGGAAGQSVGLDAVRGSFDVSGTLLFTREATDVTFPARPVESFGAQGPRIVDADGDGLPDVLTVLHISSSSHFLQLYRHLGEKPDLLISVRDGRNRVVGTGTVPPTVAIQYAPLTDGSVYQRGACPRTPHAMCMSGASYVVKKTELDAGLSGTAAAAVQRATYSYKNGRVDTKSRAFLGFAEQMVRTTTTGGGGSGEVVTRSFFSNTSRDLDPRLLERWTYGSLPQQRKFLERTQQTWVKKISTGSYFNYVSLAERKRYEWTAATCSTACLDALAMTGLDGLGVAPYRQSAVRAANIDIYGNVGQKDTTYGQNIAVDFTRVVTTYDLDVDNWLVRRPKTVETTDAVWDAEQGAQRKQTRTRSYTYRASNGIDKEKPIHEERFASAMAPGKVLSIDYEYGISGATVRTTTKDVASGEVREATAAFDPDGYPHATRNALGHTSYTGYDPVLGVLKVAVDVSGLRTDFTYDSRGRLRVVRGPSGATRTTDFALEQLGSEMLAKVETKDAGGATSEVLVDRAGRTVRARFKALDGALRERTLRYNGDGLLAEETTPHPVGAPSVERTTYQYDDVGRKIGVVDPDGRARTWSFSGLQAVYTDTRGTQWSNTVDYRGQKKTTIDAEGTDAEAARRYVYGPFETLLRTRVDGVSASVSTRSYDDVGNLVSEIDAERGTTTYGYNAFQQPTFARDAAGRETTTIYDALGRVDVRTVRAGTTGALRSEVDYSYDALDGQVKPGRLLQEKLSDATDTASGAGGATVVTTTGYSFDALGRLQQVAQVLPAESGVGTETLQVSYGYDALDRLQLVRYPQLPGQSAAVEARYEYAPAASSNGQLAKVKMVDGGVETLLWEAVASDGQGRLVEERSGDGVRTQREYDWRSTLSELYVSKAVNDVDPGRLLLSELYDYDTEGNLTSRARFAGGPQAVEQFGYDAMNRLAAAAMGSLSTPDDTWSYDDLGNLTASARRGTYVYDAAKPTQVQSVSGGLFGARSYGYDAVGDQTTRPEGVVRYNDFHLPVRIESTGGTRVAGFVYAANGRRLRKLSSSGVTTYLPGLYERVRGTSKTEHRLRVSGGGVDVATLSYEERSGGLLRTVLYSHGDRLGSTSVVTANGSTGGGVAAVVKEQRSYDAFGLLRNPDWTSSDFLGGIQPATIAQGYTGHDDDRELGLIDMKGRLFDPKLGRFLTADPNVDSSAASQAWNRYKYVSNNPLRGTDPSGFEECMDIWCDGQDADEGGGDSWFESIVNEWWAEDDAFFDEGPWGVNPTNSGSPAANHIQREEEKYDNYVKREMKRVDREENLKRLQEAIKRLKMIQEALSKVGRQGSSPSQGPRFAQQDVCPEGASCHSNVSGCSGEGQNMSCPDVGPSYSEGEDVSTSTSTVEPTGSGQGGAGGAGGASGGGVAGAPGSGYDPGTDGQGGGTGGKQTPPIKRIPDFGFGGVQLSTPKSLPIQAAVEGIVFVGKQDGKWEGGALLGGGLKSNFGGITGGGEWTVNNKWTVEPGSFFSWEASLGPVSLGRLINPMTGHGASYVGIGERLVGGAGWNDEP